MLTGGGPGHAGIGAVQSEGPGLNDAGADGISYLPFNPTSDTFGAPVSISEETPFTLDGADELSASEDSAGGLYACWTDGRGVMLAHSSNGGASWQTPAITGIEGSADQVVLGTSPGLAAIAYTANPAATEPRSTSPPRCSRLARGSPPPTPRYGRATVSAARKRGAGSSRRVLAVVDVDPGTFLAIIAAAALAGTLAALAAGRGIVLPVVVIELLLGVVLGPELLGLHPDQFVSFFSDLGLGMLFFFAGYEIDVHRIMGQPLRLALLGWALSLALAYTIGGALAAAGIVLSLLYTGSALATTAIGTLIPILSDSGELRPASAPTCSPPARSASSARSSC